MRVKPRLPRLAREARLIFDFRFPIFDWALPRRWWGADVLAWSFGNRKFPARPVSAGAERLPEGKRSGRRSFAPPARTRRTLWQLVF
jgi:hypothetical protein